MIIIDYSSDGSGFEVEGIPLRGGEAEYTACRLRPRYPLPVCLKHTPDNAFALSIIYQALKEIWNAEACIHP